MLVDHIYTPLAPYGPITLYAQWYNVVNFDLNYNSQFATSSKYILGTSLGTLPKPTRDNYTFIGWNTIQNSTGVTVGASYTPNTNIISPLTLYAKWIKNTITYIVDNVILSDTTTYISGSGIGVLGRPSKTNYTFAGWYTQQNSMVSDNYLPLPPYGPISFYAKWDADAVCLLKNTPILTNNKKYVNIQDLRAGDYIQSVMYDKQQKIKRVVHNTHRFNELNPLNIPYKIPKHFINNLPIEDIYISGLHALIFIKDRVIDLVSVNSMKDFHPVDMEELRTLGYIDDNDEIEYYNIELEESDGMFVGGIPVETLSLRNFISCL